MKKLFGLLLVTLFLISCNTTNKIHSDYYVGNYNIAEEYYNLKKYDKAVVYYEKCLDDENFENVKVVSYKLAKTYMFLSRWSESLTLLEKLQKIDIDNTNIAQLIAYNYIQIGKYQQAESIYDSLIKKNPNEQSSIKNLILLKIYAKDYETAKQMLINYKDSFPLDDSITIIEKELKTKQLENTSTDNTDKEKNVESNSKEN